MRQERKDMQEMLQGILNVSRIVVSLNISHKLWLFFCLCVFCSGNLSEHIANFLHCEIIETCQIVSACLLFFPLLVCHSSMYHITAFNKLVMFDVFLSCVMNHYYLLWKYSVIFFFSNYVIIQYLFKSYSLLFSMWCMFFFVCLFFH